MTTRSQATNGASDRYPRVGGVSTSRRSQYSGKRTKPRTIANPVSFLPDSPDGTKLGLVGMRSMPGAVDLTIICDNGTAPSENSTRPLGDSRPPSHWVADP